MDQFKHVSTPQGIESQDLTSAFMKLDHLCELYRVAEDKRDLMTTLHTSYWYAMVTALPLCISSADSERFEISSGLLPFINFGHVCSVTCPHYEELIAGKAVPTREDESILEDYTILHVAEWFRIAHARIIKREEKEHLATKLSIEKKKLENYPASLDGCVMRRDLFSETYPEAEESIQLSHTIERLLSEYYDIKDRIASSELISPEERTRFVDLTNELERLRDRRKKKYTAFADMIPMDQLEKLDSFVEVTIQRKRVFENNVASAKAAVDEDKSWRNSMSVSVCREMLRDEIRRIRVMTELAAKRSRIKPVSVLTENCDVITQLDIVRAIEEILDVDPTLARKTRRKGRSFPRVLCIPVRGDGLYDFENELILIPIQPTRDILQSVATALIEYHLDTDVDNELRNAFLKLKKNKGVNSSIQLRERMVKDYVAWVTLEAKGRQVLDKETRQWFVDHIAPPLYSLKHPRSMSDFSSFNAPGLATNYEEHLKSNPNDFDVLVRLGITYWRIDAFERACDVFVRAAEVSPNDKDAVYNAGISCAKIDDMKRAVGYFQRYLQLDRASFWMLRAQGFLKKARFG